MQILHFSTSLDVRGAAGAAYQVHNYLKAAGHTSKMIVRETALQDDTVTLAPKRSAYRRKVTQLGHYLLPPPSVKPGSVPFNFDTAADLQFDTLAEVLPDSCDVICLHWITQLLTAAQIRKLYDRYRCPIVWVMMDQEPVTGGCHYSLTCEGYTKECGQCPVFLRPHQKDLSHIIWRRKLKALQSLPITFVAASSWVAEKVAASSLFKNNAVRRIALPLDTTVFRPFSQAAARDLLHLPPDKKIIFAGARFFWEERKGLKYFVEALQHLETLLLSSESNLNKEDIHILLAGEGAQTLPCPFAATRINNLKDEITLALAYQAADLFVCSSTDDAGPMMISEAMLCGTPVVAFKTGIAPDLVENMQTGYLAESRDALALASGIYRVLASENHPQMGTEAQRRAYQLHEPTSVMKQYQQLFEDLRA